MSWIFGILALLVLAAGLAARRRIRATRERELSDELVRRIEETGTVRWEPREALDLEEIQEEEDAFWAQTWDEPEEL